jgi:hypothetical protein
LTVYTLNPLEDGRWAEFVRHQSRASIFHTTSWLESVRRTYGYEPVVYTTSPPAAALSNGVVLCRIKSWLTGRRMVSLPFADHCEPLVERPEDREAIFRVLWDSFENGTWNDIEIRPRSSDTLVAPPLPGRTRYCLHTLDLRPSLAELFRALHKDCIQRKIRRAEREALLYEEGRSEELLDKFYRLLLMTRRRHKLPPQPLDWFRNLIACLGDRLTISVLSKHGRPLGSIVTLRHGEALVYKYGASDARFHNLGTMPLLFWTAIQTSKNSGVRELDLGRSDYDDAGLVTFKDRLGAARSTSTYVRYALSGKKSASRSQFARAAGFLVAGLPDRALTTAGRLLYRHIG